MLLETGAPQEIRGWARLRTEISQVETRLGKVNIEYGGLGGPELCSSSTDASNPWPARHNKANVSELAKFLPSTVPPSTVRGSEQEAWSRRIARDSKWTGRHWWQGHVRRPVAWPEAWPDMWHAAAATAVLLATGRSGAVPWWSMDFDLRARSSHLSRNHSTPRVRQCRPARPAESLRAPRCPRRQTEAAARACRRSRSAESTSPCTARRTGRPGSG